jgi:hypothetical protein
VFAARYGLNLRVVYINPSKPSGHYMYRQFNFQQFYFLPTHFIYVFCVDLKKTAIFSLYSINGLCFMTETESGYSAVRIEPSSIIRVNISLQSLRLRSGG